MWNCFQFIRLSLTAYLIECYLFYQFTVHNYMLHIFRIYILCVHNNTWFSSLFLEYDPLFNELPGFCSLRLITDFCINPIFVNPVMFSIIDTL